MRTYVKVVWDLPPGLEVAQRRQSRKRIKQRGKQSGPTEVKTHQRIDKFTTHDEQGNVTDTAQKVLHVEDWDGTPQELCDDIKEKEPQEMQQHMTVAIVGNDEDARQETGGNPEWGEE